MCHCAWKLLQSWSICSVCFKLSGPPQDSYTPVLCPSTASCSEALLEVAYLVIYLHSDDSLDHAEELDPRWRSELSCRIGLKSFYGHRKVPLKSLLLNTSWRTSSVVRFQLQSILTVTQSHGQKTYLNVRRNFSNHSCCTIHFYSPSILTLTIFQAIMGLPINC